MIRHSYEVFNVAWFSRARLGTIEGRFLVARVHDRWVRTITQGG